MFFLLGKTKRKLIIEENFFSQKQYKKELTQLKENMDYSQQLAHMGSWTHDIETGETFFTNEVYRILETSREEFDGRLKNYLLFVHPDDLEIVKETTQKAEAGKEYEVEYRIKTPNGKIKYIYEKTKTIYAENKNPAKTIGIIQDITERKLIENNLRELGKDLNQAQRVAGVGSWKYDVINDEFYGTEEMYRIYNIDPQDFNNDFNNTIKLIHPDDRVKIQEALKKHMEGQACTTEFRIPQQDGTVKYVIGKGEPLLNKDGQVVAILGTLQDVTENKLLQKEIERKQAEVEKIQKRFQVMVQESSDVFEIIAPDGTFKYVSEASENVTGYKPEERIGRKVYEFYDGEDQKKLEEMINFVLSDDSKKIQGDVVLKTKGGKELNLEAHLHNLLHEPAVEGIVVHVRDITKRVEMEQKITYISNHDELTGLPNSTYFKKQLRLQCQYAKENHTKFALMMLDIDGLKYINYSLGHEYGDRLIIEIVNRIKKFFDENIFMSRYSDDHFAIIVQGFESYAEYESIVLGLIGLFSQPYKVDKYHLDVSINVGICIFPEDSTDADDISKQSKIALIRAKREGRNTFKFYSSDLDIQNYKEFIIRNDLHHALEKGQLKVYYQPIVNIKTSEILAVEVLLRWEHPDWGIISSDDFIYLAEESGFIIDIGNWLLREVCKNYRQWLNDGLPAIKVAINFSSIQFLEEGFVKNLKNIIREFELDPNFLIMEITESTLMRNADKTTSDIRNLKSIGIQVALDDFGTGYSSLAYLNSLNIDIIKIDGSFIRKIHSDQTSKIITKTIINMAKDLGIKLVAEGIEAPEQLSYLKELKCHAGQGYIYSKPMPLKEFRKILARKKCKPIKYNAVKIKGYKDKRKYFRLALPHLLETDMTIIEVNRKKTNVGNTKVLVENIGPGGLCFISNIKLPVTKNVILQFESELLKKEIKVYGFTVWIEELDNNLYKHGVEFTIDENERANLISILNQIQIKMRNNILFADGRFVLKSYELYFNTNLYK